MFDLDDSALGVFFKEVFLLLAEAADNPGQVVGFKAQVPGGWVDVDQGQLRVQTQRMKFVVTPMGGVAFQLSALFEEDSDES